jgi:hypothetical protein
LRRRSLTVAMTRYSAARLHDAQNALPLISRAPSPWAGFLHDVQVVGALSAAALRIRSNSGLHSTQKARPEKLNV